MAPNSKLFRNKISVQDLINQVIGDEEIVATPPNGANQPQFPISPERAASLGMPESNASTPPFNPGSVQIPLSAARSGNLGVTPPPPSQSNPYFAGLNNQPAGAASESEATPEVMPEAVPPEPAKSKLLRRTAADIQGEIDGLDVDAMGREKSFGKRLASGLWKAFKNWGATGGEGGLAGLAGAALVGGVGSAASPGFHAGLRVNDQKQNLLRQLGGAQKQEEWQTAQDLKEAQKQTIYTDDANNRARIDADAVSRTEKLKEQKRTNFFRQNKNFDPSLASEAQRKQLSEIGETPESIGKYDFTNPKFKTVGGATFQFNPATKSFDATNLPTDGSKEIVEYSVVDPSTGVVSKYATTSERAASLKNQLASSGLQIQAAEARQASQQKFQGDQNEANRQLRRETFLKSFNYKIEQDAKRGALDKLKLQKQLTEDLANGDIDQATHDEMTASLNKF